VKSWRAACNGYGRTETIRGRRAISEEGAAMNSMDVKEANVLMRHGKEDDWSGTEAAWGQRLTNIGTGVLRYGLVILLVVIGSMKFFAFEAKGIQPLVAHSPFLSWMYQILSVQWASNFFGFFEITTGILIVLRRFSPRASAVGSLAGVVIFLTTLSFLFTTPGALAPGSDVGGFLMKDIILLGAAVLTAGEALHASSPE
jgi:reactive chlorine resistance protein C